MSGTGAHPDPTLDPIERELARTVFRLGPFAQSVSLLAGLVLALALSPVVSLWTLALWYLVLAATVAFRVWLIFRFRQADTESASLTHIIRHYRYGILASGVAWGSSIALTAPTFPLEYMALTTMVLAGMTAGATMVLAALRGHLMFFAVPAVLPAAVILASRGDLTGIMAGLLVGYFILAMRRVEQDLHGVLRRNAELSSRNRALASRLSDSNELLTDGAEGQTERTHRAESRYRVLQALYQTTSVVGTTLDERLREMLRIGCRYFGLPYGVVSHIEGGIYTVREIVAVDAPVRMSAGQRMPLKEAVCAVTFDSDEPIAFSGEAQRAVALAAHPSGDPSAFCNAYIGARIQISGRTYGTMCFYDTEPQDLQIEGVDREFARLMAQWVSRELSEQQLQEALRRKADELALITNSVNAGIAYADRDLVLRFANRRYRDSLGEGRQDIVGRALNDIIGEADFATIEPDLKRCLAGLEVRYTFEREVPGGDIAVRDVSLVPDLRTDGTVRGIFALVYDVTEASRLKADLDGKIKELQLITDSVTAGIGYTDGDQVFRYINRAYLEFLGKSEDQIVGKHLSKVIGEKDYAQAKPLVERCLSGEQVRYQAERRDPAGDKVHRSVSLVPDLGEDGTARGIFALIYDVTEERRLQDALDEKVKQLHTITDSVNAGIGYIDRDLTFVFTNRTYSVILGRAEETLAGLTVEEVMGPTYFSSIRGHLDRVLAGESVTYEAEREYSAGRKSVLQVTIEPDVLDGDVVGMFVFGTDITEFRDTELALVAETDLAETTLDSVSESVIRIGVDGVIEFMNPAAVLMTGMAAEVACGRSLSEVLPLVFSDGRQLAPMVLREVVGRRVRLEPDEDLWLKRPGEGSGAWIRCLAVPLRSRTDGLGEGLLLLSDVTAQRRMIQELAHRATHDTLTGLHNRRELERQLTRAVDEAAAGAAPFALIFLDLDGFKEVNDELGHLAGDQMLAQIADAMRETMRQEDVLARIGGDEFAVLARNCSLVAAQAIAEKLRVAVRATSLTWGGNVRHVGVSIGIAPVGPDSGDARSVLNLADQACYAAKRAGKDRIELAVPDGPVH
jgi:diguanylate cyclase (GGDEF)-like protein/PAS domain S-box-containing protein